MQDKQPTMTKQYTPSLVISTAMLIRRYYAERIAQYDRSRATLDATQVFAPYHPGGRHGH